MQPPLCINVPQVMYLSAPLVGQNDSKAIFYKTRTNNFLLLLKLFLPLAL